MEEELSSAHGLYFHLRRLHASLREVWWGYGVLSLICPSKPRVGNIPRLTGSLKVTPAGEHQSPADWDRIFAVWLVFHFLLVKCKILGWGKIVYFFFLSHFQHSLRVINTNTLTERSEEVLALKCPMCWSRCHVVLFLYY